MYFLYKELVGNCRVIEFFFGLLFSIDFSLEILNIRNDYFDVEIVLVILIII